jgi:hypothetical protein
MMNKTPPLGLKRFTQVLECLLSKHEALGSILSTTKEKEKRREQKSREKKKRKEKRNLPSIFKELKVF